MICLVRELYKGDSICRSLGQISGEARIEGAKRLRFEGEARSEGGPKQVTEQVTEL